ncbi:hypothetical protein GQ600_14750 [Phytophthora cactorum]|nr:hypothetical protein GQ600_14750 [Phytophthora cactorum]
MAAFSAVVLVTAAVKRSWMHTDDQCTPITSREHHCEGVFGDEFPDEAQRDLEKLRLLAPLRAPLRRLHTTRDALPELSEKLAPQFRRRHLVGRCWMGASSPLEYLSVCKSFRGELDNIQHGASWVTRSLWKNFSCIALAKTTVSSGTV